MSQIKIKAKTYLSKKTLKLFSASFLSFILRYGFLFLFSFSLLFLKNPIYLLILKTYNEYLVYALTILIYLSLLFFTLLFISAVKLGENFIYFSVAEGYNGRFLLLFKFLKFKNAFRALNYYFRINFLKTLWLIYYIFPTAICAFCIYYLYNISAIPNTVYLVLAVGGAVILGISLVMIKCTLERYAAASYYLCLESKITPLEAIKKSIHFTDGHLIDGVYLTYSFFGWFLLSFLIIPMIYVVPYYKLSKCIFICEALSQRKKAPLKYPINLLSISSQHINKSHN